ncbi:MAG TPA: hypothetical protein PLQ36_03515, partial [Candidatus Gracilibacteria bacterium]|nr:hypothetical protein [Candidatus Gracilibacteria bacterium]
LNKITGNDTEFTDKMYTDTATTAWKLVESNQTLVDELDVTKGQVREMNIMLKQQMLLSEEKNVLDDKGQIIVGKSPVFFKEGKYDKINQHLYAEIINRALEKGQMEPEDKFFFLIRGVASGFLDLNMQIDMFNKGKLHSRFPAFEMLKNASLADIKKIDEEITGIKTLGKTYSQLSETEKNDNFWSPNRDRISYFFSNFVSTNAKVDVRIKKIDIDNIDAGDTPYVFRDMPDITTVENNLKNRKDPMKLNLRMNGFNDHLKYLDYKKDGKIDNNRIRKLAKSLSIFGVADGILSNRYIISTYAESATRIKNYEEYGINGINLAQRSNITRNFIRDFIERSGDNTIIQINENNRLTEIISEKTGLALTKADLMFGKFNNSNRCLVNGKPLDAKRLKTVQSSILKNYFSDDEQGFLNLVNKNQELFAERIEEWRKRNLFVGSAQKSSQYNPLATVAYEQMPSEIVYKSDLNSLPKEEITLSDKKTASVSEEDYFD